MADDAIMQRRHTDANARGAMVDGHRCDAQQLQWQEASEAVPIDADACVVESEEARGHIRGFGGITSDETAV